MLGVLGSGCFEALAPLKGASWSEKANASRGRRCTGIVHSGPRGRWVSPMKVLSLDDLPVREGPEGDGWLAFQKNVSRADRVRG